MQEKTLKDSYEYSNCWYRLCRIGFWHLLCGNGCSCHLRGRESRKIENLQNGRIPIYEPGLDEMVMRNFREGRLSFTTHLTSVLNDVDIVFCAVGTPPDEDGSADLRYVLAVAKQFGENIQKYTLLVTKSTVPIGTAQKVKAVIQAELDKRCVNVPFDVASNPEFLKKEQPSKISCRQTGLW